jgi:hypothetical protein
MPNLTFRFNLEKGFTKPLRSVLLRVKAGTSIAKIRKNE